MPSGAHYRFGTSHSKRSTRPEGAEKHKFMLEKRERTELEEAMRQSEDGQVVRRCVAVLEVASGGSISAIARKFAVERQTIYNWLRRYQEHRSVSVLYRREGAGRPRVLNEDLQRALMVVLGHSPVEYGFNGWNWTTPLLREYLMSDFGVLLSEFSIQKALNQMGYVWKRPRYVLVPDPEREKKT